MVDAHPPSHDIDSAILRTCRLIYQEALPILYGSNLFEFRTVDQIQSFQYGFILTAEAVADVKMPPISLFAFESGPYGRLSFLRNIHLRLDGPQRLNFPAHHTLTPWTEWSVWMDPHRKENKMIAFPALEELTLDFDNWTLSAQNDGKLRVSLLHASSRNRSTLINISSTNS